jgi:hypothetical protein
MMFSIFACSLATRPCDMLVDGERYKAVFRTNSFSRAKLSIWNRQETENLTILSHNDDIRTPNHFACKGRATRDYDEFPAMQGRLSAVVTLPVRH